MAGSRQLRFDHVPPAAFTELIELVERHGVIVRSTGAPPDIFGIASHQMGEIAFEYDGSRHLTLTIHRNLFRGSLMLGGIRQHVQEMQEKHRHHALATRPEVATSGLSDRSPECGEP